MFWTYVLGRKSQFLETFFYLLLNTYVEHFQTLQDVSKYPNGYENHFIAKCHSYHPWILLFQKPMVGWKSRLDKCRSWCSHWYSDIRLCSLLWEDRIFYIFCWNNSNHLFCVYILQVCMYRKKQILIQFYNPEEGR